jgi:hypothetical protein
MCAAPTKQTQWTKSAKNPVEASIDEIDETDISHETTH